MIIMLQYFFFLHQRLSRHSSVTCCYIKYIIILLITVIYLNGCAWIIKAPPEDIQARQLADQLMAHNSDMLQFKGLARIRVQTSTKTISGRAAWAAASPHYLRVQWLNMIGQPFISLVSNETRITLLLHQDNRLYHLNQSRTALQRLVQIPIGTRDLTDLLAGRPLLPGNAIAQNVSSNNAQVILIKNRWHRKLARLEIDTSNKRPKIQIVYNDQGELLYQINWVRWQRIAERDIPRNIKLRNNSGEQLSITVDRFWDDVNLPPETFELSISEDR